MFYWPLIEEVTKWVKEQGGWVYWTWVIIVGLWGGNALLIWADAGFKYARTPLIILAIIWIGGGIIGGINIKKGKTNL